MRKLAEMRTTMPRLTRRWSPSLPGVVPTRVIGAVAMVGVVGLAACAPGDTASSSDGNGAASTRGYDFDDPEVTRVYTRMMATIAPDRGWERARYLEFDRASPQGTARRHRWDRWEGDARYEAQVDGRTLVAIFNVNEPSSGRVWVDGEELSGDEAATRLTQAYRSHINDGYWLLMPFKWDDPGVSTRYLGEREALGRAWEVVELWFDEGVGLTPSNRYHAFLDPESGRMEYWHHFSNPEAEPSPSEWTDWQRVGTIELAENRRVDGEIRSHFPHLRVETSVPEGAFDPPEG